MKSESRFGSLRGRFSLLCSVVLAVVLALSAAAFAQETPATDTSAPAPTIQSDKEDYPPGDTVILTGRNWQPGEAVNILVNDDEGQTWNRNVDVTADENGDVRDEFVLPDWFVATYSVEATGSSGAIATTTFTDATLPARGCPGPPGGPILVNTTQDQFDTPTTTNTECSLREAINAANGDTAADTIILPPGTYTLTRTGAGEDGNQTGDLDITRPLTINGAGARAAIIQAGTTNSNGIDRVLHVSSSGSLTLSGATVGYGQINDDGGGIKTDRPLTLTDVAITENDATNGKSGGGISHQGQTLTLNRVTISGNTANLDGGGLHSTSGSASLTNVTITNNSAASNGGGLRAASDTKTLVNATVSHNSAPTGSNISRSGGTVSLRNTIVSDGAGGGANCGGGVTNTANNLDSGTSCGFTTANNSKSSANANLGALANNGGPTDTRSLGTGSAAINAGTATSAPNVDQRGVSRPQGGAHDIGAFEVSNTAPAATEPTFSPASPKTNDDLQASTTTSDADGNNVSVVWVWKVTRGANTCQVKTETSAAAAPGARTASLDLGQSYTTSNCTGASPPASIDPSKGDTVIVEATPNDGTVNGTMQSKSVVIANSAPTCATVSLATDEDTTGSASPDCTDADGDTLAYSIVAQGTEGTASVTAGGQLQYVPSTNATGADSFTYKANDGAADSDTATVNVTINAVNDAPVANDDDGGTTNEDVALDILAEDLSANDTDVDDDTLSISDFEEESAEGGTVSLDNGTFTYTPDEHFFGTDSFTYTVDDGSEAQNSSDTATVSITVTAVNDDPVATDDEAATDEDEALVIADANTLVDNDSAGPGNESDQNLSVTEVSDGAETHGTVSLGGDGKITYTPDENYNGPASFDYKVCDDGKTGDEDDPKCDTGTVNVTVRPVNDAPVADDDDAQTSEDTPVTVDVLGNDTDADGDDDIDPATVQVVSGPSAGTATVNAAGTITYAPDANFNGEDTFTYKVCDKADPPACSDAAEVTVTITAVNDAPVADDDAYDVDEDQTLTINAPGVLEGDTDVDGDALTAIRASGPSNGTLTLNPDGSFTYAPDADFNGEDSFTYSATDSNADSSSATSNTATVTITVDPVNDDPVANDDMANAQEEGSDVSIDVLSNDDDGPDTGETLSVDSVTQPAANEGTVAIITSGPDSGKVRFTPDADFFGTTSFTYTISDGNGGTATATVNVEVSEVNDAPQGANDTKSTPENTPLVFLASDLVDDDDKGATNESEQTLTVTEVDDAVRGQVSLDKGTTATEDDEITFTPETNYNGPASFKYTVCDDGTTDGQPDPQCQELTAVVEVTVSPVNSKPVAQDGAETMDEDADPIEIDLAELVSDTETSDADLAYTIVSGPAPEAGTLSGSGPTFTFDPANDFDGEASFTYTITDRGDPDGCGTPGSSCDAPKTSDQKKVTITVNPVNDKPVADDKTLVTDEDTPKAVTLSGSDADGNDLAYAVVQNPEYGALSGSGSNLTYTPNANYHGPDSFTYEANDGSADSDPATVSISVDSVNDKPVADNDSYSVDENGTLTQGAPGVLDGDTDADSDALTAVVASGPSHGSLTLNSNGSFSYAPNANYSGSDSFTYKANDGSADSGTATVSITVKPVGNCTITGTEGPNLLIGTSGNDVICGKGGNDIIIDFKGGNDTLIGDGGKDIILDTKGNDTLKGGEGADVLLKLDKVRGNDRLDGEGGNDACLADQGDIRANCERGSTSLLSAEERKRVDTAKSYTSTKR